MAMRIPLSQPSIGELETANVRTAITSGWVSGTGPSVKEFEDRLCLLTQRKHAVAVTNGTAALELALKTLGVGPGDEVIVPALTFAAPAAAVLNAGATPVLVDIHPKSWCLDPEMVRRALTNKTHAVIAVDLMGHPADYRALHEVLGEREVEIIEDAAEAHGAWYEDRPVGSFGLMSTFSFHANKAISTGEGGALLTSSGVLADTARLFAHHGMTPDRPYYHVVAGHNMRMTNLTAALGCAQLQRWPELVAGRNRVKDWYDSMIPAPFEARPMMSKHVKLACWLYAIQAEPALKDAALKDLRTRAIDARPIWPALVDLPLYRKYANERQQNHYKVAREVSARTFWLPTWIGMPESAILEIVETLKQSVGEAQPL